MISGQAPEASQEFIRELRAAVPAVHFDRLVSDEGERFLEALLHADTVFLPLPAVVRRTVVFDAERDAHAGTAQEA